MYFFNFEKLSLSFKKSLNFEKYLLILKISLNFEKYLLNYDFKLNIVAAMCDYNFPLDKQWEFKRSKLKLGAQLGEGAFGSVVKAEAQDIAGKKGIATVAVKMLKEDAKDREVRHLILN